MLNSWRLMLILLVVWPIGSWTQARNIPGELEVKAPQNMLMDLKWTSHLWQDCRTKPNHLKWQGYRIGWDRKTGNLTCCSRIKWVTAIGKIWKATKFGKWCLFKKGRDCQLTPTATEGFRRCWKMVDDSMFFFGSQALYCWPVIFQPYHGSSDLLFWSLE